jgi:predicted transcriptional regulator
MNNYLIEKYIGEGRGLRKTDIFKKVLNVLGNDGMDIDQISKAVNLPIAKQGLQAHIEELVKKGKVTERMKKGKYIWFKK